MCLIELSLEAATSFATAARTSSIGETESAGELEGVPDSREAASLAASETPSKTAIPIRIKPACLILSGTLPV